VTVYTPNKIKEPHYFSRIALPDSDPRVIRNEKQYLALIHFANDVKAIGETSPSYLLDPEAANLIKQFNSNSKIIIILRNPVTRAYSGYQMRLRLGEIKGSFLDSVEKAVGTDLQGTNKNVINLNTGLYFKQTKR